MKVRFGVLVTAILFAVTAAISVGSEAQAVGNQVCGNGGSGYCLNDWNGGTGSGNPIKMYYGGYTNDAFEWVYVNACGGTDRVHAGEGGLWCPFRNHTIDSQLDGAIIAQIWYYNAGNTCLATAGNGLAVLGTCARQSDGGGGSNGVIFATAVNSDCPAANHDVYGINRYWSDINGTQSGLASGGNVGSQAFFVAGLGTCWDFE
jgi:hypothetical protein